MTSLTRRSFLTTAAATAAASALETERPAAAQAAAIPLKRSEERVVVIGSGFGGGVTALRLGQAGVPVLVLERGQWWPTGPDAETFPHAMTPDKRDLFYSAWPRSDNQRLGLGPYAGLLEPVVGENLIAVVAAGVGGGSLVYAGMTLQPTEALFSTWYPGQVDYSEMDSVYYPRVARMLAIETAPDELISSPAYADARIFADGVRSAGYQLSKIPMPIDWTYPLDELAGKMKPSYTNGDCLIGVNNGGKHSVDVTYIRQAQATGNVTVATLHNVTSVAQAADGRWQVHVDVTDTAGTVIEQKIITATALFMAAGTVNTTKLLVSAAGNGSIKDLPDGLGQGYGTNGDQTYLWSDLARDFGATQGGPVIYGSFEWDTPTLANTVTQTSLPPVCLNTNGKLSLPAALLPEADMVTPPLDTHSTLLFAYGVSETRGQITYNPATGGADLKWPAGGDAALARRIQQRVSAITGRESAAISVNSLLNFTIHSLGGACMGVVCDTEGRVHGKSGLYVVDGALLPGTACACNPSMTIAAIAERALDRITATDVGTVF